MPLATLQQILRPRDPGEITPAALSIDNEEIAVRFRRNARARRIILRMDKGKRGIVLTLPPGITRAKALDFAISQAKWIKRHLQKQHDRIAFADGAVVPVKGELHKIVHQNIARGIIKIGEEPDEAGQPVLQVPGDPAHAERRLRDWFKAQARADLAAACTKYAEKMELRYKRISIRDQSSRWGSCSTSGNLSFSWRLVLAPPDILDYVAAHEVAHLAVMNHSPAFWELVRTHCSHTESSKRWLKTNGAGLHLYG